MRLKKDGFCISICSFYCYVASLVSSELIPVFKFLRDYIIGFMLLISQYPLIEKCDENFSKRTSPNSINKHSYFSKMLP